MPKARYRLPVPVLKAALEKAQERRERWGALGVGFGYKHSRRHGYGEVSRPCIKVFVARKKKNPSRRERIEKSIEVRVAAKTGKKRWRVPTDVLWIRSPTDHASINVAYPGAGTVQGTPGIFVWDGRQNAYVVTAGHVFLVPGTRNPPNSNPKGYSVTIDGVACGDINNSCTYIEGPSGIVDVGVVSVPEDLPTGRQAPWQGMTPGPTSDDLFAWLAAGRHPIYTFFGSVNGGQKARFDSACTVEHTIKAYDPDVQYAPVIVYSRATEGGAFAEGDSGGPFVVMADDLSDGDDGALAAGELVGLRIIGIQDDSGAFTLSAAVLGDTALSTLQSTSRLGMLSMQPPSSQVEP